MGVLTFDEYVGRQQASLSRLATVLAGDGAIAEDVVADVLFKASRRWQRVSATDHPHAYVRRMVVNEYLSWRRKWARVVPRADVTPLLIEVPDHADLITEQAALLALVASVPVKQRAAIVLRYYEDLDDHDIAAVLGCGESAVRSNIARALATLNVRARDTETERVWTPTR